MRQPDFVERIADILAETGLPAAHLKLELTESMIMGHGDEAVALLRALKDLGLALSIDDFGTGYSSLAYLKRFPIDELKIDQSFVRDIPHDSDDMEIATAIISLARSLRLKVVAEGLKPRPSDRSCSSRVAMRCRAIWSAARYLRRTSPNCWLAPRAEPGVAQMVKISARDP